MYGGLLTEPTLHGLLELQNWTNRSGIKMRIQTEASKSGTATFQVGMLPIYPTLAPAIPKVWLLSQVEIHAHGSLDHAFPIWRSENNQELMDYSGCGQDGCA